MAYNPTTGIITAPIGTSDLQKCFAVRVEANVTIDGRTETINVLSGDIGVNCALEAGDTFIADYTYRDALGTHVIPNVTWTVVSRNEINKWAKYKPERADGPKPLIHGDATSGTRSRFANKFGLEVPYCPLDMMNAIVHSILVDPWENVYWNYLKPRGNVQPSQSEPNPPKEYFRITDFVQLPNDITDPNYQQTTQHGYNHLAEPPLIPMIVSGGVTEKTDDDLYYEVNVMGVSDNKLVISFVNSKGYDLHIQDFVTLNPSAGDNEFAWRPVIQIFNEYTQAGEDEWYERSNIGSRDLQFAGSPLGTGDMCVIEIPLNDSRITNWINEQTYFHACMGIGYCKKDLTGQNPWYDNNNSLFIMPYDEEQFNEGIYPFYYCFKFVSHFDRHLEFERMLYYQSSIVSFVGSSANIPANAYGTVVFEMSIKKSATQKLHFVGEYGSATSGYEPLKIALVDMETGTYYYLTPTTGLNRTETSTAYIGTDVNEGTMLIYGMTTDIDVGNIPVGGYGRYQVKAYIGDVEPENANAISIHKLNS